MIDRDEALRIIRHDTAACYRFVKSTSSSIRIGRFPSYLKPTQELLIYLDYLSRATMSYLDAYPARTPLDEEDFRKHRQELWIIRSTWKALHAYVKPAIGADTLNAPTTLVELLTRRVQRITSCGSLQFAVIHTDKINYFHFPAGDFEAKAVDLAEIVGALDPFPPNLGIIALPHSQARHLFLNGLLAHEVGHHVFNKLKCLESLKNKLNTALAAAFPPPVDATLDARTRGRLPDILSDWAEELFCDLFGTHLLGPSFVLASIELFDLANAWSPAGKIDSEAGAIDFRFSESHPARFFRLWRQAELLRSLGWWDQIKHRKTHHVRIIEKSLELRPASFTFTMNLVQGDRVIDALCRVIEDIEAEVARITSSLRNEQGKVLEVADFGDLNESISLYLSHAVVPSTLLREDKSFTCPSPLTLLNAGHLFYLDEVEGLMTNISGEDAAQMTRRDVWMEKLENWVTKGLEDLLMVDGKRG